MTMAAAVLFDLCRPCSAVQLEWLDPMQQLPGDAMRPAVSEQLHFLPLVADDAMVSRRGAE